MARLKPAVGWLPFGVFLVALLLGKSYPSPASDPVTERVVFDSPVARWSIIEDAGFGAEGLRGGHLGVDLLAHPGTPVMAAADGEVVRAEVASMKYKNDMGKADVPEGKGRYFGTNVVVAHAGGRFSLYGHLRRIVVHAGDHVARGQVIGYSGNTGSSTGPHLHFAVANSSQFWGYAYENFGPIPSYLYQGVTYYNPELLVTQPIPARP